MESNPKASPISIFVCSPTKSVRAEKQPTVFEPQLSGILV